MKRLIVVICGALAWLAVPALAAAQTPHQGDSRRAEYHASTSFVVGTETLPAGDYHFQCKMIDGRHFMVVTSDDSDKEVARVPCEPEQLAAKNTQSEFRSLPHAGGLSAISSVRFRGEMVAHRLIPTT